MARNYTEEYQEIIKESFVNILLSQHHKRIRYPKQDELENNSKSDN